MMSRLPNSHFHLTLHTHYHTRGHSKKSDERTDSCIYKKILDFISALKETEPNGMSAYVIKYTIYTRDFPQHKCSGCLLCAYFNYFIYVPVEGPLEFARCHFALRVKCQNKRYTPEL